MHRYLDYLWYKNRYLGYLFFPLAGFFYGLALLRKKYLQSRIIPGCIAKPVIVVGNITVGGTGKTPLVIALVKYLQSKGFKPGVISRGYGGVAEYPCQLTAKTQAGECGDEPLLIYKRCACPVVVSPLRLQAAEYLLQHNDVDIIISDDGLQHYALPRDLEIVVIDGQRGLGNGLCLPVGPLREPAGRLKSVDFVLVNGEAGKIFDPRQLSMQLKVENMVPLEPTKNHRGLPSHSKVNAVAAIGNPQRFYSTLEQQGYHLVPQPFPDHYLYQEGDLVFANGLPVVMTEKDAIKCDSFLSLDQHWYLPVNAILPDEFWRSFHQAVKKITKTKKG
jgi:tetraacyldisaccharide 4'-kinase